MTGIRVDLEAQAQAQAEFCQIFGHPQRILILWALEAEELSVGEIARATDDTLQNTSRHLHRMKDKGVLTSRRMGQTIYYRIVDQQMLRHCHRLMTVRSSLALQDLPLVAQSNEEGDTP